MGCQTSLLEPLAARIRAEYREMPGLRLTLAQACRLWQVDAAQCSVVLETLVQEGFLIGRPDGRFVALSTASMQAKVVKANLTPLRRGA